MSGSWKESLGLGDPCVLEIKRLTRTFRRIDKRTSRTTTNQLSKSRTFRLGVTENHVYIKRINYKGQIQSSATMRRFMLLLYLDIASTMSYMCTQKRMCLCPSLSSSFFLSCVCQPDIRVADPCALRPFSSLSTIDFMQPSLDDSITRQSSTLQAQAIFA